MLRSHSQKQFCSLRCIIRLRKVRLVALFRLFYLHLPIARCSTISLIFCHIRSRLKNSSLLTSSDPRLIQFYFDCFFNSKMISRYSRFVLNRGLQELFHNDTEKSGAQIRMNEEDSRKIVNELASAFWSEAPTFFFDIDIESVKNVWSCTTS